MAITNGLCHSFKAEILTATHNLTASTGDVFKIALYPTASTIGPTNATYTSTGEVANGNGYTTGGNTLTTITASLDTTTGIASFANSTWASSSITAGGALIYNSSKANKAVEALTFSGDKVSASGDFIVQFPANVAATAVIRIA